MPEKGVNNRERKLLFYRKEIEDTEGKRFFSLTQRNGERRASVFFVNYREMEDTECKGYS